MKRFENRMVIVTGVARGANHARRFAAEGANVIVAAHGEDGRELADELGDQAIFTASTSPARPTGQRRWLRPRTPSAPSPCWSTTLGSFSSE